jgi:predicted nucleic acid-binding protein
MDEAVRTVDAWLDQPNIRLLTQGENHWAILRKTMLDGQARGAMITDAQLSAITMEYGGTLHTTDRDFARFPGLRWTNPLF